MTESELVKCAQLDMLIELDRICKSNSIPYFVAGGTLLGTIRHSGFIPWDDDIDVGMLRENYEKFIVVCKDNLSDEYSLYDWDVDENSPLPYLKMKIKGTHYREELSKFTEMNDEIYIDIFPLDNAPDSKLKQKIHGIKNVFLKKILLLKCGFTIDEGPLVKKILYFPLRIVSSFGKTSQWKKIFRKNAAKYQNDVTKNVVNLCGSYSYDKELKKRDCLEKLTTHRFESTFVSIPEDYDKYLHEVYGDYMILPPENKRISRHGISLIDLGNYRVKSKLNSVEQ